MFLSWPVSMETLTNVRVEYFLQDQLEKLLRKASLINTLLSLKLNKQLFLQVRRFLCADQLQLQHGEVVSGEEDEHPMHMQKSHTAQSFTWTRASSMM